MWPCRVHWDALLPDCLSLIATATPIRPFPPTLVPDLNLTPSGQHTLNTRPRRPPRPHWPTGRTGRYSIVEGVLSPAAVDELRTIIAKRRAANKKDRRFDERTGISNQLHHTPVAAESVTSDSESGSSLQPAQVSAPEQLQYSQPPRVI